MLARIDHPGVVGILDTGELLDGSPFLVIQDAEGESLREALRNGPLARRRVADIVCQIGSALGAANAIRIAHCDLKPENVMLQRLSDGTEHVKLIDFGIAKMERSQLNPATTTVMIAGTVRYMAPEQFQSKLSPPHPHKSASALDRFEFPASARAKAAPNLAIFGKIERCGCPRACFRIAPQKGLAHGRACLPQTRPLPLPHLAGPDRQPGATSSVHVPLDPGKPPQMPPGWKPSSRPRPGPGARVHFFHSRQLLLIH